MTQNNLAGLILFFIFFLIGCYLLYSTIKIISKGERVEGTIVGYTTKYIRSGGRRRETYSPKVQFYTKNNESMTVEYSYSHSSKPELYKKVYLYYDINNPKKILIDAFVYKWLLPISLIPFGLIGILLVLNTIF